MEQRKEQFDEKVLINTLTKDQWINILKNAELVGLKEMKIILDLYANSGQPLKTSLIGEELEFCDVGLRIQNLGKKIAEYFNLKLSEGVNLNSWEYKFRYWLIMLEGEKVYDEEAEKSNFKWILREEVKEAVRELLYVY
ncbi:hypothetical protein [Clostridium sp. B9]|uniref:hypothetical protein n=1 Tax=Clostridium sp. B9 TaxID=3423224 RepID=UPI003D2EB671